MTNTNMNVMDMNTTCEVLMDEALKNVSGGFGKTGIRFEGHVGKYDGVIGQKYHFVEDDGDGWIYGILVRSYEEDCFLGWRTKRVHLVKCSNADWGGTTKIYGDDWTIYKKAYDKNGKELP